jgi:multidrug resistance efflux pump
MSWYKVITGSEIDPGVVLESDEERYAFALAEAEAHLANAVREEERFLEALETGENLAVQLRYVKKVVTQYHSPIPKVSPLGRNRHLLARSRVPKVKKETITMKWTRAHVRHAGLARYRKAAEVRRHKALQAWIKFKSRQVENLKRTQIRLQVV